MSSKKLLLVGICVMSLLLASMAQAATKIGVIDVQQIITKCKAGPGAQARFEKQMKKFQAGLKKERDSLLKLKKEIEKKQSAWSKSTAQKKITSYQKKVRELQVKEMNAGVTRQKIQQKELKPILDALDKVVKSYGKKNKYTAIVEAKAGFIYFDKNIDLTKTMIKKLNAAMK